ncbi:MAG: hypothetical protein H7328_12230 [Bdellovibrio sp.]|nr:hypothetical protein [Bdellovibrio sp.]
MQLSLKKLILLVCGVLLVYFKAEARACPDFSGFYQMFDSKLRGVVSLNHEDCDTLRMSGLIYSLSTSSDERFDIILTTGFVEPLFNYDVPALPAVEKYTAHISAESVRGVMTNNSFQRTLVLENGITFKVKMRFNQNDHEACGFIYEKKVIEFQIDRYAFPYAPDPTDTWCRAWVEGF